MFALGFVLGLALVASSCGESDGPKRMIDRVADESATNEIQILVADEVPLWNFEEMFGVPVNDETPSSEPEIKPEPAGNSAVWKVLVIMAVLLLALVGVLSTFYYLCVWRGRMHYEPQKDVSV